jgi:hypothetical protein
MEKVDYFLNLEEVAPGDKGRYYVIVSKTGYVADGSADESYFTANGGACIPTYGIDSSEVVNEFLEDCCGEEAAEEGFFDPLVFYGEICNPAALEDELMDDYFLFIPQHSRNMLIGYRLYTLSGIDTLIERIESIMKERKDLEIEDLLIFRGEEVPLSMQLSPAFDQADVDQNLGDEDA